MDLPFVPRGPPQTSVESVCLSRLFATAAVSLVVASCQNGKAAADRGAPVAVNVASALFAPIQEWDEFNGRVRAVDSVEVRPRITGYIERVAFKEGDEVRKGDLLFEIDSRPYRAALDSTTAQLEHARATAALAEAHSQRAKQLVTLNAVSKEEAETREAEYAQGQADLRAAEAAVAAAKLNLEFSRVRAPITGRVSRAMLTPGNLAVADQSLLTSVVSQDPVYVYFDPDEQTYLRYGAQARKKQNSSAPAPVRVGLANEQGFPHAGIVDFLDNQIDPTTGTIHVRAVLRNGDRLFIPGMYAHVLLAGVRTEKALLIDDKAVLTDQDRKYVYVLGPGDKALRKDVKLGPLSNGLRVIESGLSDGDIVVVDGLQRIIYSGLPIKPTHVPMDASASRTDASEATAALAQ